MKRSAYYAKVEKRNFKLRFIWQVGKMQIFQRSIGREGERNNKNCTNSILQKDKNEYRLSDWRNTPYDIELTQ